MRQSHLFAKTIRDISGDIKVTSHKLLLRAGFIFPISAGIYALSPLGFKVVEKIKNVIRDDFNEFGVQEMVMPIVHPASIWKQTGRLEEIGRELWKIQNKEGDDFVLAMTHEEIVGFLGKNIVQTYRDLPILINQFQIKIRDELRARGGILRLREFLMQDAYSFDKDEKGLDASYNKFYDSYLRIFKKLSLEAISVEASGGVMGKGGTHEFMLLSDIGEDTIIICDNCDYRANIEVAKSKKICPKCKKSKLKEEKTIELGHTFKLELKYSKSFNVKFRDNDGKDKLVYMGSYGIGIERVMAGIVEIHNDDRGIIWPEVVSPFRAHLISLGADKEADKIYRALLKSGVDVLYDDRQDKTPGEKFADSDLIGISYRLVVSKKTLAKGAVEIKKRGENKITNIKTKEVKIYLNSKTKNQKSK